MQAWLMQVWAEHRLPVFVAAGGVVLVTAVTIWLVAANRRRHAWRSARVEPSAPLVIGRIACCSLCDATFHPPLDSGDWARCPECRALVRI